MAAALLPAAGASLAPAAALLAAPKLKAGTEEADAPTVSGGTAAADEEGAAPKENFGAAASLPVAAADDAAIRKDGTTDADVAGALLAGGAPKENLGAPAAGSAVLPASTSLAAASVAALAAHGR